jgi:hypothetical protein
VRGTIPSSPYRPKGGIRNGDGWTNNSST